MTYCLVVHWFILCQYNHVLAYILQLLRLSAGDFHHEEHNILDLN